MGKHKGYPYNLTKIGNVWAGSPRPYGKTDEFSTTCNLCQNNPLIRVFRRFQAGVASN